MISTVMGGKKYNLDKDGYDLTKETEIVESVPSGEEPRPIDETNHKKWLFYLLTCLIIIVIGVIVLLCLRNANDDTSICKEVEATGTSNVTVCEVEKQNPQNSVTDDTSAIFTDDKDKIETSNLKEDETASDNESYDNSDTDFMAKKVIRGDYGNGIERKNALGSSYQRIQDRVNELYAQGFVR